MPQLICVYNLKAVTIFCWC